MKLAGEHIVQFCHPERSEGSIPPLKAVRRFGGVLDSCVSRWMFKTNHQS